MMLKDIVKIITGGYWNVSNILTDKISYVTDYVSQVNVFMCDTECFHEHEKKNWWENTQQNIPIIQLWKK